MARTTRTAPGTPAETLKSAAKQAKGPGKAAKSGTKSSKASQKLLKGHSGSGKRNLAKGPPELSLKSLMSGPSTGKPHGSPYRSSKGKDGSKGLSKTSKRSGLPGKKHVSSGSKGKSTFERAASLTELTLKYGGKFKLKKPFLKAAGEPPLDHINTYGASEPETFRCVKSPIRDNILRLNHGLEKVLFSPGVHFFQDPRTRRYNFTPYLSNIVKYEEFDFDKVPGFISASEDKNLLAMASKEGAKYLSSTSSMTQTLSKFYLFLNGYDPDPEAENCEKRFPFPRFTKTFRTLPASLIVLPKDMRSKSEDAIYSVTPDKSSDIEHLLSAMGHCLETLLTTDEEGFKNYLVNNPGVPNESAEQEYNYSSYGKFIMRSQLDCYNPNLPNGGSFDLKTRAVCAIRHDSYPPAPSNYQIWRKEGEYESFSREYDDLIRTGALLKYCFQARIGQMDGIFLAYHNIKTFFGFEYLPLEEIDRVFFSNIRVERRSRQDRIEEGRNTPPDDKLPSHVAQVQFKASLDIWAALMDKVINDLKRKGYNKCPFRLNVTVKDSSLFVYAVPLTPELEREVQKFLRNFKTSFRHDLTPDERRQNIIHFLEELDKLDEKLVTDVPLLAYQVRARHSFDNSDVVGRHPYPQSSQQPWKIGYSITPYRLAQDAYVDYSKTMKKVTDLLRLRAEPDEVDESPLFIDVLRYFGEVGQQRQDQWKQHEKKFTKNHAESGAPRDSGALGEGKK